MEIHLVSSEPIQWQEWVQRVEEIVVSDNWPRENKQMLPAETPVDSFVEAGKIVWIYGTLLGSRGGYQVQRLTAQQYESCLWVASSVLRDVPDLYDLVEAWVHSLGDMVQQAGIGREAVDHWFHR